jgi:hypothetical protein
MDGTISVIKVSFMIDEERLNRLFMEKFFLENFGG